MRAGWSRVLGSVSALVVVGAVWAGSRPPAAAPGPNELLYLQTRRGITALDTRNGSTAFTAPHATPAGNWSRLFVAGAVGTDATLVRRLDPATGRTLESVQLLGHYRVQAVTGTGDQAVLVPVEKGEDGEPGGSGTARTPYRPEGRATTELVVVRFDGSSPRHLQLTGNVEPEAFSSDGSTIFALDYRPALSPDRYRVRRIDVATGAVSDVPTNDKEVRGDMQGVARTQALAPDGRRLYTLYTVPGDEPRAFVHVLGLDSQTANCVDLPVPFGRDTTSMALAPSPDGAHLYVADAAHGVLADVDTRALAVTRTTKLHMTGATHDPVSMTATNGAVFVARGSAVTGVSSARFRSGRPWHAQGTVAGIQTAATGTDLYVALRNRVVEI
ncbi:MAG TPA: hypothetical protein VFC99_05470, partial [Acidimicrobiia bacterium]|nr:hypothetical protein [Acidimicrobiia bacterium]